MSILKVSLRLYAFAAFLLLPAVPMWAQLADQVPEALQEVGVTEHLGAKLPLDATFTDERGERVSLGQYFDGERPVILTLNYYKCPMLCGLMLNGVVDGLEQLAWSPGEEFEMVTISINPLETPELAAAKKQNYLKRLDRPGAGEGWHFLTGYELDIERVAEAVGFGYSYDPETQEYAHAAAIMVITPDGRVTRYLYGIEYPAKRLKFALLEAAEGTIGSPLDQLILYCYHYDPTNRRYSPVAMNIMRVGGSATALILGISLGGFWLRDWRRKRKLTDDKETAA
jgi:protein SCO1/2